MLQQLALALALALPLALRHSGILMDPVTDQATDQVIPIIAQEIDDLEDGLASVKIQVVAVVLAAGAVAAVVLEVEAVAAAAVTVEVVAMVGVLLRRPPASATRPAPTPPPKIACWTVSATR